MFKKNEKNTISFNKVLGQLKKKETFKDISKDIGLLANAVSALLAGPLAGTAVMTAIETAKACKLYEILSSLLNRIIDYKDSFSSVSEQMDAAYATICYTAFFETFSERLPPNIIKGLDLKETEKMRVFATSTIGKEDSYGELVRPDIAYGIEEAKKHLFEMYKDMTLKLREFFSGLNYVENADEDVICTIRSAFEDFASIAVTKFEEQYYSLCIEIPQFYSYISIKTQSEYTLKAEEKRNKLEKIMLDSNAEIKAGFSDLKDWLPSFYQAERSEKAIDAAKHIIDKARKEVSKPIFGNEQKTGELVFPSIEDAFIPQSYKVLIYNGEEHLENSKEWNERPDENNQAAFWAKFFNDPKSIENLLLILGEPGIGKSLITKVIAAQMGSLNQVIIRIPLRNTDIEKNVESIILDQINTDGDVAEPFKTLKAFTQHFTEQPLTVIFDGYDELQQATGRVYQEFLNNLSVFQQSCIDNERPVRIVITSRATLIDKAAIPIGTVVLQLNEFDNERKNKWITIWNNANKSCFENNKLREFMLPRNSKEIEKLSGQPLLLLMLAIYDADIEKKRNVLGRNKSIIRTQLYNELIRRFIRRELTKGKRGEEINYQELNPREKTEVEEQEMKRLGTAALGMFVRGKLSITVNELKGDLALMKAEINRYSDTGRKMLKDEEAFFGSFFFIHDPRPLEKSTEEFQDASFEFLHKTFYEFLVADIVLQSVLRCIRSLCKKKTDNDIDDEMNYEDMLEALVHNPKDYLLVLSGASLCSEPVIIEMMIEWSEMKSQSVFKSKFDPATIKEVFYDLFRKHAEMMKAGRFISEPMSKACILEERTLPQICSAYLMNIVTTAIAFNGSFSVEADLWKYSSRYIRLNLPKTKNLKTADEKEKKLRIDVSSSDEMILRFISHFEIEYKDSMIVFKLRKETVELEKLDLLTARMEVFDFLGESEQKYVYSMHRKDIAYAHKSVAMKKLAKKGMDIQSEIQIDSFCARQARGEYDFNMEPIYRTVDGLRDCRDEAFVQKTLNSILSYMKTIMIYGNVDSSYRMEYLFHAFLDLCQRFDNYKGIINTIISIVSTLLELINIKQPSLIDDSRQVFDYMYKTLTKNGPNLIIKHMLMHRDTFYLYEERDYDYFPHFFDIAPDEYMDSVMYQKSRKDWHNDIPQKLINQYGFRAFVEVVCVAKYCGDNNTFQYLLSNVNLEYLLRHEAVSAQTLIKLYRAVKDNFTNYGMAIQHIFIERFPEFYMANAESAVNLFCELAHANDFSDKVFLDENSRICSRDMAEYILDRYSHILDQAFSVAILALINFIRLRIDSQRIAVAIKKCFNKFIYDPCYEYADRMMSLIGVFGLLQEECKNELNDYFANNYHKIRHANKDVADRLDQYFNNRDDL